MKEPTAKAIDQFIERLIRGKLEDGQLSDCQLSLRDIDQICSSFSGILKGVYHERIEYPKVNQFAVKGESKPVNEQNSTVLKEQNNGQSITEGQADQEKSMLPHQVDSAEKTTPDANLKEEQPHAD